MQRPVPAKPVIDVVEAISFGYRFAWQERAYLARLAFVPVLVKLMCQILIMLLGANQDYVRQALISLPSYFAEGWMLSHVVRLVLLNQRWPYRPSGEALTDIMVLQDRARGILTGTVMYVLVRFFMAGFFAAIVGAQSAAGIEPGAMNTGAPPEITTTQFFVALVILGVFLWAFRYIWLFLPAAVNCPPAYFLRHIGGVMASVQMLGVWMMGNAPLFFVFMTLASSLIGNVDFGGGLNAPTIIFSLLWIITDMAAMVITSAAFAFGYRAILTPGKQSLNS